MIYILARYISHAEHIAARFGLSRKQWVYLLSEPHKLDGLRGIVVLIARGWDIDRRDSQEMLDRLYYHQAEIWRED